MIVQMAEDLARTTRVTFEEAIPLVRRGMDWMGEAARKGEA
jgi:hypothetical protein